MDDKQKIDELCDSLISDALINEWLQEAGDLKAKQPKKLKLKFEGYKSGRVGKIFYETEWDKEDQQQYKFLIARVNIRIDMFRTELYKQGVLLENVI